MDINSFNNRFVVTYIKSDFFSWTYCSIVPKSTVYKLLYTLIYITLALLSFSLVVGFILAFYNTKKMQNSINNIVEILSSAETNNVATTSHHEVKSDFDYIIQNILNIFIQQNYLKVQLSEKKYRLQVPELLALQSSFSL